MEKSVLKNWILKAVCFYNVIALLVSTRLILISIRTTITQKQDVPWVGWLWVIIFIGILFLFAFSTLGLWHKRLWAFFVQLFLYVVQLVIIQSPDMNFAFYIGMQYILDYNSNFGGKPATFGINVIALIFLALMMAIRSEFHESATEKQPKRDSPR